MQSEPERDTMETRGDPKASSTLVAAVVGAAVVLIIVIALQAMFYNAEEAERVVKVINRPPEELNRLRAQEQDQLNSYRWVDQRRGVVRIPIDRAMELTVRDQGVLPQLPPAVPAPAKPSLSPSPAAPAAP